jgi:phosphopantetheinyl transferase (holo-ACP synthase)
MKDENNKPYLEFHSKFKNLSSVVSISHEGDLVISSVIIFE